ncbi:filamentous hemagglutinin adherence factor [Rhizobium sp. P32RR-XVIII]|uniref:translocation/assembly module TamB domain-containing protein n=1 Tax=Rhizobium sp. P32RR-XVIII TaxID=2726738 RepID=UPI0014579378|nr:translocation/assembly module TamB domain-containing protein [Rhizobium sp. P32RR-XVIII]NLS06669.1 filamentous hemagglutinin adherence factor [Rhizobium sp. P32RR-XVIII]
MQALTKFANWTIKAIGVSTGVVLILAAAAIAIFGFTSFGSRIITQQVAEILSNRDMTIKVREPGSLLSGGLRAAEITVSDTRGVFAQINGLSIDWNPLALLRGTFDAQEVLVDSINVIRKPVRTIPSSRTAAGDGGFNLPIKIDVDKIAVAGINLSEQFAGHAFTLTADGSNLKADRNGGSATINVGRPDVPDAKLLADMAFRPDRNQLRLKAQLTEPKGGLLAAFLSLPGDPAVNLAVDGDGPISDWNGRLQASLDGQQRASIEGRHALTPDGLHHVDLKGGGDLSTLLPPAFRPLFSGQTNIDVSATFDNKGKLDIQTGNIATGSVVIAASGTLDRRGNNSLNANVLGTSGPVDFRWPLADGEARFMITGLNLALTGDAQTARLNASASLDAATLPKVTIGNVKLTAKSEAFNLTQRSGAVQLRMVAGDSTFTNPDINRAVQGPVTLVAPLQIAPEGIGFNGTTFESANANGTVNGTYKLDDQTLTGNTKLVVQPAALPPAIAQRFDTPIAIETQVSGTIPSKISLSNLAIKSGTVEAAGTVTLDGDNIAATLSGRLPDLRKLTENAEGEVSYAIDASGPITAPVIKASVSAATLHTAGRTISDLNVEIFGNADPAAPRATVDGKGAIDNQPIAINANVQSAAGAINIPSLVADVASNRLQGSLQFSPGFEPTGTLEFDFPDIGLLAMFGGQKAQGDLKGTLNITNDAGKIRLKVTAAGNRIQRDTLSVIRPHIDVTVTDLRALAANGVVSADEISSGTNKLAAPTLTFVQQQNHTNFDLKAAYDNNPLLAAGNVEATAGNMTIRLDRFSGKPRNIPVELSHPAEIAIANGRAMLNDLAIKTGNGSVTVSGSAGETLDIAADIKDLPASLANTFVPNLDAAGAISGTGSVKGTPAAPIADFKLDWKNAEVAQTKRAGLAPFDIAATGKYVDNTLDFDTTLDGADELALKARGNIVVAGTGGRGLKIDADVVNLPAKMANGFVPDLAAEGAITGKVTASGTLAAPAVDFDLDWKDAATSQTRRAGLAPLSLSTTGKFADNRLGFNANLAGADRMRLRADGNVVIAGTEVQSLQVNADLNNVPADVANSFVPGLAAEGTISGTAKASGTIAAPAVDFNLAWKDAATSQTKSAGLKSLGLNTAGRFADNKLDFNADLTGAANLSLKADGNVTVAGTAVQNLQVNASLANVPASIANSFVPGLAAEGTLSGTAKAAGTLAAPGLDFDLDWKDAATSQTKSARLKSLGLSATGKFADNKLDFNANANAADGVTAKASGNVAIAGKTVQSLNINADISNVPASIANGFVPGLAADGIVSGTVTASGTPASPAVDFKLDWKNLATSQTKDAKLSSLDLTATGKFADNKLDFNANASGADGASLKATGNATIAGKTVETLRVDTAIANLPAGIANNFVPGLAAEGIISGTVTASGSLASPTADFKIDWKNAATSQTKSARLSPLDLTASGKFADNRLDFDANASGADGASLKATGNVAIAGKTVESLRVDAAIADLPAGLANNFVPGLAAEGIVSGTVTASGSLASPTAEFKIDWKNAATSQTRRAGLSQLALNAAGKLANNRLDFKADLNGAGNVSLKAGGNAMIEGTTVKNLDVKADLSNLPASVANGFVPGLAAEGRVSGTASVSGPLSAPKVDFKLDWRDAATSHTRGAGLPPFAIAASGHLTNNTLAIDSNLRGGSGLSMQGGGSVAITGNRALNLQVRGNVPFAMFGAQLAQQGFVADGTANIDLRIAGTAAAPLINGTIATSGARLVDVRRNLALNNVTANISMNGEQATISRLSGNLASGGSIAASGTIGIRPGSGYPANIEVRLDRAVYVDGTLLVATVDGNLGLRGPLLSSPTLSGRLNVEKASITVPDKLPTSLREIDVRHINAPPAVRAQMRDESQQGARAKSTISLDLRIDAPARIFVRGRGIDSELGGSVTIRGTAATPIVSGGFTMRRGRLTILNRRLTFTDRSRITFAGDLTPALDMEATSVSGNTTLTVDVTGLATDPSITFSSSPTLPQDEVLAQLIFGQSMSKLSPVQIAQLADAVSQLAGGRSTSLFEGLRNQLGVDDLNISTDERGQTSVSVGRYLNERTYFELQQGGRAGAKAIINLDVGRGVKLRGAAGGDGAGEAGVFYEHEY